MTDGVRAGRGWKLWLVFVLGLAVAPLNAFAILFWRWASTHHATDTAREDTIGAVAFCVLFAIMAGAVVAMVRRWKAAVLALSLAQLVPALLVLIMAVIGFA